MIIYNLDLLRSEVPGYVTKQALRIMKLTTIIISAFLLQVSAHSHAQKVSLNEKNASLERIISSIREQTGYDFIGNANLLNTARPVTIKVDRISLEEALRLCFENQDLVYSIEEKTVVLKPKEKSVLSRMLDYFAQIEIRGSVQDTKGNPLPGVVVSVKAGTQKAVTNPGGNFTIKSVDENATLIFSMIGYVTQSVEVSGRKTINIQLLESTMKLEEVVVMGYTTVKKSDLTASVGQVNIEELAKAPVASFTEALAGRVAGVQVSSQDGQPGKGMGITIRGANSLTQSNAPLYVIDGFPVEDPEDGLLNPDDIESISIMKDAAATAIYGSRAANGIVMIETKRGKAGKPVVALNTSYGFQQVQKTMEVMSPYEFVKYQTELNLTAAEEGYFIDGKNLESYRDDAGTNWQDLIFKQSPISISNIAVRGGNVQTKYAISGSVYDQEGIIINTGYKRYQGRATIDQVISKRFKAGITANYSRINTYGQQVSAGNGGSFTAYLLSRAWGYRPVTGNDNVDLTQEDGDVEQITQFDIRLNPIVTSNNEYNKSGVSDFIGNGYLIYTPTSKLTFKFTGTVESKTRRQDIFYNSKTTQGSPLNPLNTRGQYGSVVYTETNIWSNDNTVTYKNTFDRNHNLTLLGGFSFQNFDLQSFGYASQNVPNQQLGLTGLDEGTPYSGEASTGENFIVSYFGRVAYNYKSKYLVEGTIRSDGSSKFSKGNKWGYFPSGSFAWNMHTEEFIKNLKYISNSKLRVSYGSSGNNRVGNYDSFPGLGFPLGSSYSFFNSTPSKGAVPSSLGNQSLRWETTSQFNVGYDLGLFNNRIELTADWYKKTTSDLLLDADLPATMGFLKARQNIGKIQNTGIELSLKTTNIKSKVFEWGSSFNIAFNRNKILELVRGQQALYTTVSFESQYSNNPAYISEIGQPAGMFYGYIFDGIYQLTDFDKSSAGVYTLKPGVTNNGASPQPGHIKYRDMNGDATISTQDLTVIGRGQPLHTGGFTNNFFYKGFDLNVFMQWSYGNDIMNANRYMFEGNGNGRISMNQYASYADRWSETNPSNTNFIARGQGTIGSYSSRVIEDGSYIRLKTVSFGYNVPSRIIKSVYLSKLRLTVAAQNLLTITNYSGMDPEVSVRNSAVSPGFDFSAYPIAKTLVFGLNATF
jgi:TonB-linked SusC/RagA family outer membrane protein